MPPGLKQLSIEEFPPLLREIPDPPKQLFARGTIPSYEYTWLTVVGSRKYSPYGKEVCEELIRGLRGHPVVIVSGLALGIDTLAHKAALDAGLPTVAVPGSGLDESVLYPRSNHSLARAIADAGALLSEYELLQQAAPWTFPQRNRIMAGISHATLVIEAMPRSGTLITSRLATDYDRDVLTVPGSIFNANSHGPLMLLRLGATPVASASDILDALGLAAADTQSALAFPDISEEEQNVLAYLHTPLSRDDLMDALNIPAPEANTLLMAMEIKGLIKEELGMIRSV